MTRYMNIKINKAIPGHEAGSATTIKVDPNNIPVDKFWRDRLKDAEIDNCIEVIKAKKKQKDETAKE